MLQRDYLVKLFSNLAQAIRRTIFNEKDDPRGSAETLEQALTNATEIDGETLLSLSPESMASILQVTGTDPRVCGYVAHTLQLESDYLVQAGEDELAKVRAAQARALAEVYNVDLDTTPSALNDLVNRYAGDEDEASDDDAMDA